MAMCYSLIHLAEGNPMRRVLSTNCRRSGYGLGVGSGLLTVGRGLESVGSRPAGVVGS